MNEGVALPVVILFVLSACAGGMLQVPTTATTPPTYSRSIQPCLIYTDQSQELEFCLLPQGKGLAPVGSVSERGVLPQARTEPR